MLFRSCDEIAGVAKSQISKFLATATSARRRFLVVAYGPSQPTIRWIGAVTKDSYTSNSLGVYDGVSVTEYDPR